MLEIGLANGVSALFIGEALAGGGTHVVIDPMQSSLWNNAGLDNLRRAGLSIEFHETGSELALPRFAEEGRAFDLVFIDGFHTFDHAMVDVFYATRLLDIGGVLVLDDAHWPSIAKLNGYVSRYPCYRRLEGPRSGAASRAARMTPRELAVAVVKRLRKHGANLSVVQPSCVAFEKIAADERPSDWFARF